MSERRWTGNRPSFGSRAPGLVCQAAASAIVLFLTVPAWAQQRVDPIDWTNPLLGPRYAQWLVGPIGYIAGEKGRAEFLALTSDQSAEEFVGRFWSGQRADLEALYERRAAEADRLYSEAAYPGRRTDRGTLYVLYGEPSEIEYEQYLNVEDPPVELWSYSKGASPGLDGTRPRKLYRFAKDGDLTRLFRKGGPNDPAVKRRRSPGYRGPPSRPFLPEITAGTLGVS